MPATPILIVACLSGAATVVFIVTGLWRAVGRHQSLNRRELVLTTAVSLLTGAFTVWQLVLAVQQLHGLP